MTLAIDLDFQASQWIPLILLLGPWPFTKWVLIPLGMPRLAFAVTHLAILVWPGRPHRGAFVAASWAALRSKRDEEKFLGWMEAQLGRRTNFGSCEVTAYGLIAAKRGHIKDARTLMGSVILLETRWDMAQRLSREWLVAEAIGRGAWQQAHQIVARTSSFTQTRASLLLGAIAGRLTGKEEVSDRTLWALWLLGPRRRQTMDLVKRATRHAAGATEGMAPSEVILPAFGDDLHRGALLLHAALHQRDSKRLTVKDLCRLAQAWDRALEAESLRGLIQGRAQALGTPPEAATRELAEDIQEDLSQWIRTSHLALGTIRERGPTLNGAIKKLGDELLSKLELSAKILRERIDSRRALSIIDEWREWLDLQMQAQSIAQVGEHKLRRLSFAAVHGPLCGLAVWLFNDRGQRHAAHAIFRWLLKEARAVGDTEAVQLQESNVSASAD